jgi:hypothetical protein
MNSEVLVQAFQYVGFALWQIQELETTLAHYLVIVHKIEPGVAVDIAEGILEKARKKTLGQLVKELKSEEKVPQGLFERLESFVEHRNWLAHRSRGESRKHLYQAQSNHIFFDRVDWIADEALSLGKAFCEEIVKFVEKHGVSKDYIEKQLPVSCEDGLKAEIRARRSTSGQDRPKAGQPYGVGPEARNTKDSITEARRKSWQLGA